MAHRTDCPCPACRYRRGEGKGQAPQLSVRVSPEVRDYLLSHPAGARAMIERLVAQDQGDPQPSREQLLVELAAAQETLRRAEGYKTSNKFLKDENTEMRRELSQLRFELANARAALQHARHGLLKFAERMPGDIFEEHPPAIAVVARGTLNDMESALAAEPLPRARRKRS